MGRMSTISSKFSLLSTSMMIRWNMVSSIMGALRAMAVVTSWLCRRMVFTLCSRISISSLPSWCPAASMSSMA